MAQKANTANTVHVTSDLEAVTILLTKKVRKFIPFHIVIIPKPFSEPGWEEIQD